MSPTQHGWLEAGERFAKFGAGAIVILYALGFFVVSLYEASLGISAFDVLRPRVLAAAVALAVLTALPAFAGIEAFKEKNKKPDLWLTLDNAALYAFLACALSTQLEAILATPLGPQPADFGGPLIIGMAVFVGLWILTVVFRIVTGWARTAQLARALFTLGLVVWALRISPPGFRVLGLWFTGIGWLAAFLNSKAGRSHVRGFRREIGLNTASLLACFLVYSMEVYPRLRPAFGGGAPIPISLHLVSPVPRWKTTTVAVLLVDETEAGYYVVDPPPSSGAVFVPRSDVLLVEFTPRPKGS